MAHNHLHDPNLALEQLFINKFYKDKAPVAVNESQDTINESEVADGDSNLEFDSILDEIFGESEKTNVDEMETQVPMDGSETEVPEGDPGEESELGDEEDGGEEVSVPRAIIEKLYDVLGDILNYSGEEGSDEPAVEDELSAENVPTESLKGLKEKKYPEDYKGKPATKTKFLKNQGSGKGLPKGDSDLSQYIVGKIKWTTSKSKDKTGIDKNV